MEGKSREALLPEMRLDFWDELWNGQISSARALARRLSVLGLPITPDSPCCRCVLRLEHGEAYLDQIWRYGRDRLRTAVLNLLPGEEKGIVYGVCRLTPYHVYIVACDADGRGSEALHKSVGEDIARLIQSLESYLDLHSQRKEIVDAQSVAALAGAKE